MAEPELIPPMATAHQCGGIGAGCTTGSGGGTKKSDLSSPGRSYARGAVTHQRAGEVEQDGHDTSGTRRGVSRAGALAA